MKRKERSIYTALIWMVFLVFLGLTKPSSMPVIMLIVPFILLFAALYSSWGVLRLYIFQDAGNARPLRRLRGVVCGCIVLLLVLESLGQLTVRDVVTVGAILVVGSVYVGRGRIKSSNG